MKKRELICIGCPMGCMLTVSWDDSENITVVGNTCAKGKSYGEKEVTNPTRIVTSTVRVRRGDRATVSCKTKSDIPKDKIFPIMAALKDVEVDAPISIGDVLLANVANTGVEIVATSDVKSVS